MKTDLGSSLRMAYCAAFVMVLIATFSSMQSFGAETIRPIATVSLNERLHLPDNTLVRLKSGRTVSLGALRAEHKARIERFSMATGLGQAMASQLSAQRASTVHMIPAAPATVPSKPQSTAKSDSIKLSLPTLVPFPMEDLLKNVPMGKLPNDYVNFCKAAFTSACVYLPANSFLETSPFPANATLVWAQEDDYLVSDAGTCTYDGGIYYGSDKGCVFHYPVVQVTHFKPTGPLTTKAMCTSPVHHLVDDKGAIKISIDPQQVSIASLSFETGPKPVTCVVQVWIGK